jgi:acyl-CoA reductase-like NAD-dependent aldehyde dehydrogenase
MRTMSILRSGPHGAAHRKVWSRLPGRERGKFLYRIARLLQEKARELAVLESMDGGKTIKESRDIDLPLVAAHFFYYAGWGGQASVCLSRASPTFARRSRSDHSLEFPAPHGGLGSWRPPLPPVTLAF